MSGLGAKRANDSRNPDARGTRTRQTDLAEQGRCNGRGIVICLVTKRESDRPARSRPRPRWAVRGSQGRADTSASLARPARGAGTMVWGDGSRSLGRLAGSHTTFSPASPPVFHKKWRRTGLRIAGAAPCPGAAGQGDGGRRSRLACDRPQLLGGEGDAYDLSPRPAAVSGRKAVSGFSFS